MLPSLLRDLEAYGVKKSAGDQFSSKWLSVTQSGEIPQARFGSAFFNDGTHTVLFGGCTYNMTPEKQEIIEHSDIFFLNNESLAWSKEKTTGTQHPSG